MNPACPEEALQWAMGDATAPLARRVAWARQAMAAGVSPNALQPRMEDAATPPLWGFHSHVAWAVLVAPPEVLEVLLDAGAHIHAPDKAAMEAYCATHARKLSAHPRYADLLGRAVKRWVEETDFDPLEQVEAMTDGMGDPRLERLRQRQRVIDLLLAAGADPHRPDPVGWASPWAQVAGYLEQTAIDDRPEQFHSLAPACAAVIRALAGSQPSRILASLDPVLARFPKAPWRRAVDQWRLDNILPHSKKPLPAPRL